MTIDPVVSLIVGALGAAILTTVAGFVGAWLSSRREHDRWVREQRAAAYRAFMSAAERMPTLHGGKVTARDERYFDEFQEALAVIRLIGPAQVVNAAVDHLAAAYKSTKAARNQDSNPAAHAAAQQSYFEARDHFIAAARGELRLDA